MGRYVKVTVKVNGKSIVGKVYDSDLRHDGMDGLTHIMITKATARKLFGTPMVMTHDNTDMQEHSKVGEEMSLGELFANSPYPEVSLDKLKIQGKFKERSKNGKWFVVANYSFGDSFRSERPVKVDGLSGREKPAAVDFGPLAAATVEEREEILSASIEHHPLLSQIARRADATFAALCVAGSVDVDSLSEEDRDTFLRGCEKMAKVEVTAAKAK